MVDLKLVTLETCTSETKKEIVERLEYLLEKAKAGKFESFAYAAGLPDGACLEGFTRSIDFHCLLSAVTILQHRMIATRDLGNVD